ncbi:MAG: DUF3592 domain-containing protein [Aromatoleum sp.]|jgi:hypothetical protein|uniref:DUF3592 domain-containing protein n=1 Tax=Aromatoleum sp. TaxID=2307007 RepID=UPI0028940AE9|nr:DUF3592 domain-containing protein [Aromatoleum sp.]MDT3671517.1 DUF3592 domain-containing protein [Aromatoleum sp.]
MPPNEQLSSPLSSALILFVVRVGLPLIGLALLMTGLLGVVSYGVLPVIDAARSHDWKPVEATVESVAVSPPPVSGFHPQLETLEIRYGYIADGEVHVGARYDPHGGQYAIPESSEVLASLKTSPRITVWVDPDEPQDAMVLRAVRLPVLLFAVPALGLALVGGVMLFLGMLSWNHNRLTWRPGGAGES